MKIIDIEVNGTKFQISEQEAFGLLSLLKRELNVPDFTKVEYPYMMPSWVPVPNSGSPLPIWPTVC